MSGLHSPDIIRFLESIPAADAHRFIGNAGTGGSYFHTFDCIPKAMCLSDCTLTILYL